MLFIKGVMDHVVVEVKFIIKLMEMNIVSKYIKNILLKSHTNFNLILNF